MSSIVGVIPVRFGATRFPGKPLAPILGRPMLEWVLEGVSQSQKLAKVIVATDHKDIAQLAEKLGYEVKMTAPDLPTGSDRVWQAIKDTPCEVVINIQGDEPLIHGQVLDDLITSIEATKTESLQMWTLADQLNEEALQSEHVVKLITDINGNAIYFSRQSIPFSRLQYKDFNVKPALKHIGIYAYKKDFLQKFCNCAPVEIEKAEGLEQLRALYMGAKIRVVPVQYESWGVDVPEDIVRIEDLLKKRSKKVL